MIREDAARLQPYKVAFRVKEDGYFIFAEENGTLWTETASAKVKRFGGNYGVHDDWEPLVDGNEATSVWLTKIGRGDALPIAERWEDAVTASPIRVAYRVKQKDGGHMVRLQDATTYSELGQAFYILKGTFKAFDGWKPALDDYKFAGLFVELGSKRPEKIAKSYKLDLPPDPTKPPKPPAQRSPVAPEALIAAGQLGQSLARALEIQATTKLSKEALDTLDSLKRLARNVSWLLYEGRDEWKGKQ